MTTTLAARGATLEEHRSLLWGLAYRMTGVAADADDVVQETFEKALTRNRHPTLPLRPWLVAIAMNGARDRLRQRRRRSYVGPWLPEPVPDTWLDIADLTPSSEQRITLHESASLAFLCALERLTPVRRAVLLLRDVFDCTTDETATALGMSSDAVKQALSRARKALAGRTPPHNPAAAEARRAQGGSALVLFMAALARDDEAAAMALLADEVRAVSDGGGVYLAAKRELVGSAEVSRVYLGLLRRGAVVSDVQWVAANGQRAALLTMAPAPGVAPRVLLMVDTNPMGRIIAVRSVLAPAKLTRW